MKLEFPGPSQPETPKPEKKGLLERLRDNRLLKAGLVAGALHGAAAEAKPIMDLGSELFQKEWDKANMVVDYQTEDQMHEWELRKQLRESSIDHKALDAY